MRHVTILSPLPPRKCTTYQYGAKRGNLYPVCTTATTLGNRLIFALLRRHRDGRIGDKGREGKGEERANDGNPIRRARGIRPTKRHPVLRARGMRAPTMRRSRGDHHPTWASVDTPATKRSGRVSTKLEQRSNRKAPREARPCMSVVEKHLHHFISTLTLKKRIWGLFVSVTGVQSASSSVALPSTVYLRGFSALLRSGDQVILGLL